MKKAKSKAKPKSTSTNKEHISFGLDYAKTISELDAKVQSHVFGKIGSIRQLMAIHNALIDSLKGLSESNARAIRQAASVLEANVDQKIDSLNEMLDMEFEKNEKSTKLRPKTTKKTRNTKGRA